MNVEIIHSLLSGDFSQFQINNPNYEVLKSTTLNESRAHIMEECPNIVSVLSVLVDLSWYQSITLQPWS